MGRVSPAPLHGSLLGFRTAQECPQPLNKQRRDQRFDQINGAGRPAAPQQAAPRSAL